jgi:hypothetical protein
VATLWGGVGGGEISRIALSFPPTRERLPGISPVVKTWPEKLADVWELLEQHATDQAAAGDEPHDPAVLVWKVVSQDAPRSHRTLQTEQSDARRAVPIVLHPVVVPLVLSLAVQGPVQLDMLISW